MTVEVRRKIWHRSENVKVDCDNIISTVVITTTLVEYIVGVIRKVRVEKILFKPEIFTWQFRLPLNFSTRVVRRNWGDGWRERQVQLQKNTTDVWRMERQAGVKDKLTLLRFVFVFGRPPAKFALFLYEGHCNTLRGFQKQVEGHTSQDFTVHSLFKHFLQILNYESFHYTNI